MTTCLQFLRLGLIFAEVFGVSVIANDQYAPLKLAKNAKKTTKIKIILKPKCKSSGGLFFTFNPCQGRKTCPLHPICYTTATNTLNIDYINKSNHLKKCFLQWMNINASNIL